MWREAPSPYVRFTKDDFHIDEEAFFSSLLSCEVPHIPVWPLPIVYFGLV